MTDVKAKAIEISRAKGGKLEVIPKVRIDTMEDLAIAYTPGVAAVSTENANDKEKV